ncbi:MAG: radical SAM protein [Promethearchaeota archaeon]
MQVKNVDFLLTFKCPARCQHCSYKAGPERSEYIKPKEIKIYLEELTKMGLLHSVWVHGGEPFIYFKYLLKVIHIAKMLNIPHIGVITNSFWAKNEKIALEKLNQLKNEGLTELTFSFDAFHQEFIPVEYVQNAIKSAVEVGFESLSVDTYFVEDINVDNSFNKLTRNYLEILGELEDVDYHRYIMNVEGRGTKLAEYMKLNENIPSGMCPIPFWIEGDLQNPETIEIDGDGNVTLCPGICIGNTQILSLTEIIKKYDYKKHPILSYILEKGPIGLLDLAKTHGYKQDKKFASECHLCYELRKYLQPFFPYYLAPGHIYI